jgi:PAS domain S-box-containing protein
MRNLAVVKLSIRPYGVTLAAVALALAVRWLLDPLLGNYWPFPTFVLAVLFAAWYGGLRTALLATGLGLILALYFFMPPRLSLSVTSPAYLSGLGMYLLVSLAVAAFGERTRIARQRAEVGAELLRTTLASIGDAVITTDAAGCIRSMNAMAENLTGWQAEEARGQPLDAAFTIVNEANHEQVENPALRVVKHDEIVRLTGPTILMGRSGEGRPIDYNAAPIRSIAGKIIGCVLVFKDVTERRRTEKESASQLANARLLASIVESSDDAIISKSLEGVIQSWNAAAERLFGYTPDEAVGRHISLIIPPDRLAEEDHIIASLKAGRRVDHFETVRRRKDGRSILVSLTISPVKDETGRVIGASKTARDVTGQRQAEERERVLLAEAAEANAKFRAFFDQGPLFAGVMALDGTLLEANRLCLEECGYTRDAVIGKKFWECPWWSPSPELARIIREGSARAAAGEIFRVEMPYFVADGSQRIVDFVLLPIKDEAGRVLFLSPTGKDITDRKRAEDDRQKFVTLIENSTDFIGMCDLEGTPFFVNRAGLEKVGLADMEQARHTPVRDFFFPEDQHRIMDVFFPSVLAKGHGETEVRFRNFRTGKARWMAYKVFKLTDEYGRAIGLATVSQDVTERRRLEEDLRKLAGDLAEADRHKDEFLATLAHELRNPLAPIRNALQIIRHRPDQSTVDQAREMMDRQLDQMVRLVEDLLDVSRIATGKLELRREVLPLSRIIDSAIETSRPVIEHMGHQLTVTVPERPIMVDADLTRLAQVISNLLTNSAKYTDRGGQIWLAAVQDGCDVVVSVKDNGIGIPAEQFPRLFKMFAQVDRSLGRAQGGLGIGLTLVKRLAEMHGGAVQVKSSGPGKGSEFIVRLPIVLNESQPSAAPSPNGVAASRPSRRIFIVDDNHDAANSLAQLLRILGNDVRTGYDGQAAVDGAGQFRPDVLLLDIGLPKLDGYQACRMIRQEPWGKDIVIVALTGWGQEDARSLSREAGFDRHLVKPVDFGELIAFLDLLPHPSHRQNQV